MSFFGRRYTAVVAEITGATVRLGAGGSEVRLLHLGEDPPYFVESDIMSTGGRDEDELRIINMNIWVELLQQGHGT